jgi:hypothetical protein
MRLPDAPALDSIADAEFEEAQDIVLEGISTIIAEKVIASGNGTILTSDPEAGGYYMGHGKARHTHSRRTWNLPNMIHQS